MKHFLNLSSFVIIYRVAKFVDEISNKFSNIPTHTNIYILLRGGCHLADLKTWRRKLDLHDLTTRFISILHPLNLPSNNSSVCLFINKRNKEIYKILKCLYVMKDRKTPLKLQIISPAFQTDWTVANVIQVHHFTLHNFSWLVGKLGVKTGYSKLEFQIT